MVKKETYYVWYDLDDAKSGFKGLAFRQSEYSRCNAVDDAAQHFWSECDGWGWMKGGCTLYSASESDPTIYAHEVNVDFDPSFYSCEGEPI